jgi:hypothetical protein
LFMVAKWFSLHTMHYDINSFQRLIRLINTTAFEQQTLGVLPEILIPWPDTYTVFQEIISHHWKYWSKAII